ncbi:MAG: ATP-binding protein [Pseudomonadales bacterium]
MNRHPVFRGLVAFSLVISGTAYFWWQERTSSERQLELSTELTAQYLASKIELWLADRIAISDYLSSHASLTWQTDPGSFSTAASRFIGIVDGFQAINWVDTDGVIRVVVPLTGNEAALGYNLSDHPRADVRAALATAMHHERSARPLSSLPLLQGGRGFTIYTPALDENGNLLGVINSVFRLEALRAAIFDKIDDQGFYFALVEQNGDIALGEGVESLNELPADVRSRTIRVIDRDWTIYIAAAPELRAQYFDSSSPLILVFGVLGAIGFAWIQFQLGRRDRELRESRVRFLDLFEYGPVPMINWEPEVDPEDIVIREANIAAEQLCGYGSHELLIPLSKLFDHNPDGWSRIKQALVGHASQDSEVRITDLTLKTKSGELRQVEMTIRLLSNPGAGRNEARAVVLDVTNQLRLELQLRHTQKMEAIGQLAGGVAHDFNNYIQSITMAASLLKDDVADRQESLRLVEEILAGTDRAAGLVRQLLAFGRKDDPNFEVISPVEIVDQAARMVRRLIGEDVELELFVDESVAPVKGDRGQLDQVIINLCVNARDAMPRGGKIIIRVSNVSYDGDADAVPVSVTGTDFVRIAVSDTGHGVDAELVPRIFEPFFSTKTVDQGTGLGLATVYAIVQKHGGTVQVMSPPGEGATFEILLPALTIGSAKLVTTRSSSSSMDEPVRESLILIVEDDDSVRRFVDRILERAGYSTSAAGDGIEALEMLDSGLAPDLIVLDAIMPRMNGLEFYDKIRALGYQTPVILSSGYNPESFSSRFEEDPMVVSVPKPYSRDALLRAIENILSGRMAI